MNKARLIAISGLCSAVATACLLLVGLLPVLKWAMLFLGVVASLATVIPLLLDPKNLVYSLLIFLASSVLGCFLGAGNIAYVAPMVTFCIPFALVKVCGEQVKVTATLDDVLDDPFDGSDDKKLVSVKVNAQRKMPKAVKWILYFVLLNAGMALTMLATYLLTPTVFETFVQSKLFWGVVVAMQLIVYPYDFLMTGCLVATNKILHRAVKL